MIKPICVGDVIPDCVFFTICCLPLVSVRRLLFLERGLLMRYVMLLVMCVGCMEVDEVSDVGEYIEKSISRDYCGGGSRREVYDYLLSSVENDMLLEEYECEYDKWDRLVRVRVYDYLQGDVGREYLIGEVLYIWGEGSVVILRLDYMRGSPEDDYLIGREVCYW